MGVLSFFFFVFLVSQVGFGQQTTDPKEGLDHFISIPVWCYEKLTFVSVMWQFCLCCSVDALNKLIDYWNLRDRLNITDDPCIQNATWANEIANPRVACDCGGNTCHITHLSVYNHHFNANHPHFFAIVVTWCWGFCFHLYNDSGRFMLWTFLVRYQVNCLSLRIWWTCKKSNFI